MEENSDVDIESGLGTSKKAKNKRKKKKKRQDYRNKLEDWQTCTVRYLKYCTMEIWGKFNFDCQSFCFILFEYLFANMIVSSLQMDSLCLCTFGCAFFMLNALVERVDFLSANL